MFADERFPAFVGVCFGKCSAVYRQQIGMKVVDVSRRTTEESDKSRQIHR
jgi:hypothetical protein